MQNYTLKELFSILHWFSSFLFNLRLGATDPKTVDAKVLHPWIRGCFNKDLEESNGDIKHMVIYVFIFKAGLKNFYKFNYIAKAA